MRNLSSKLSYSNVVATLALFLALGGGAYAITVPKNSIGPRQIKENAVGRSEIKRNAVRRSEIRKDSVGGSELDEGSVERANIVPGAVGAEQLAPDAVTPGSLGFPLTGSGVTRNIERTFKPGPAYYNAASQRISLERRSTVLVNGTVEVSNPSDGGGPGSATVRLLAGNRPFPFTAQFTSTVDDGTVLSLPFTGGGDQFDLNPGVHTLTLQVQTEGAALRVHQAAIGVAALP